MLYNNIVEAIGNTPMVKLNRIGSGLDCNLYAKCEFLNPGGSVKDRIARQMILDAEKKGEIKPGDTLIEATSGNAGIGIATVAASLGYKVIITMPEKMSQEKQVTLEALGAKIYRTPTEAAYDSPDSHIELAKRIQKETPNSIILNQYGNPNNPTAHYEGTGAEIWDDLKGEVSMVVMGAGTGGTITGVSKFLKEKNPKIQIVGADPEGSILAKASEAKTFDVEGLGQGIVEGTCKEDLGSYHVEGIGYDFVPKVLDLSCVDHWVKTSDEDSFKYALKLIHDEGLLCGGSSGSAMQATLQEAKKLKAGQNCVVVLPDSIRNYMTKFLSSTWMKEQGFS